MSTYQCLMALRNKAILEHDADENKSPEAVAMTFPGDQVMFPAPQ